MACGCKFTSAELDTLRDDLLYARRDLLVSLMPSGVTGSGHDAWWDSYVRHTDENGNTWKHWAGHRWEAAMQAGGYSVTADDTARTVTAQFTVTLTTTGPGRAYDIPCDICDNQGGAAS